MHIGYHTWWSRDLEQEMELKVYGHAGKPLLVFPTQEGRFFEFEDFGMVTVAEPWIEDGRLRLITVDSVDAQSWTHPSLSVPERFQRYEAYMRYIQQDVVPFIHETAGSTETGIGVTGCSMGAYHAANFFFRYPETYDALLAISGVYRLKLFIGDYMDDQVYFHTPLAYLPALTDPHYLELYRRAQIIISVGQGDWEDPMLEDTRALKAILDQLDVPSWIDIWGHDVNHDWPWWRKKMAYFLLHLKI
ncbi:MAG: esterase family protein [Candidatus Sericytochromatia bacterium]|nr:esterase family protein [Candidatus Sericytochromatia bacterium]